MRRCFSGSARTWRHRSAHWAADLTRYPVTPSSICSGIPPTSPPMVGRAFHSPDVVEVGQDEHVGVGTHVLDHLLEILPALRIVARHRSDESELHGGVLRLDGTVDVDDPQRV